MKYTKVRRKQYQQKMGKKQLWERIAGDQKGRHNVSACGDRPLGPRRLDICHGGTRAQIRPDTCPATGAEDHGGRPAGCRSTGTGNMMEGKLLGEEGPDWRANLTIQAFQGTRRNNKDISNKDRLGGPPSLPLQSPSWEQLVAKAPFLGSSRGPQLYQLYHLGPDPSHPQRAPILELFPSSLTGLSWSPISTLSQQPSKLLQFHYRLSALEDRPRQEKERKRLQEESVSRCCSAAALAQRVHSAWRCSSNVTAERDKRNTPRCSQHPRCDDFRFKLAPVH